jgi:hypothetical protein
MNLRRSTAAVVGLIASACCALALLSCGHSPSAPAGQLVVHVTQDYAGPAPGKKIELVGPLRGRVMDRVTDEAGLARFDIPAGNYTVRVYALGEPGPGREFVQRKVQVQPASELRVEFNDCTMCGSPAR